MEIGTKPEATAVDVASWLRNLGLERYEAAFRENDVSADVLRDLVLETPPNVVAGSWRVALPELLHAARLGGRLRKLDMGMRRQLLGLFANSAGDYLDGWFESAPVKAVYGFDGIVGNYASPYSPGSAYVLLHHVFGEVNGRKGAWGHALGGMGAITQAMAKCAAARGVTIRVGTGVRNVIVEGGVEIGGFDDPEPAHLLFGLGVRTICHRYLSAGGSHDGGR